MTCDQPLVDNYIGTSISSGEGTENMDNYCYNVVVSNRTITCYCESTLCVVGKKKWNKKEDKCKSLTLYVLQRYPSG